MISPRRSLSCPSDSVSGNARVYPHAYAWRLSIHPEPPCVSMRVEEKRFRYRNDWDSLLVGCPRRIFIMRESGDGHWNTSSGTALPTYRTTECSAEVCGEDRQLT